MLRQKLPDGWEYNAHGEVCESAEPLHVVYDVNNIPEHGLKSLCSRHEDPDLEKYVDTRVAFAVIRNAGADPVFEVAKRVIAADLDPSDPIGWVDAVENLKKLIESLEET